MGILKENVVSSVAGVISALKENENMSLSLALALTEYVKAKASEMNVNAVVAVADGGGNPVSVQCMDSSFLASYDIALNKAYTSVALKMSTKELSKLAHPDGSLYGIQFTNNGKIVIFGGGAVLKDRNGKVLGGLGVSGGTEEEDTLLALLGERMFSECINNLK